ncbi:MAG TPA: biotin/lipoyl-containing protein [Terriglobia bacterium]|nr:biotin/lipoyl-containing protein [Terriglobia bacterium]
MTSRTHSTFQISGRSISFRLLEPNLIEIDGKRHRFYVLHRRHEHIVWLDGHTYHLQRADRGGLSPAAAVPASGEITALMPGKVLRIEVKVGDAVAEKQTVAMMESMKMESALHAPKAGRVAAIHCRPGQVVEMGELLIVIE